MDPSIITAAALSPGAVGLIIDLRLLGPMRRRLLDLGIVPGAHLRRRYTAPSGSPIAYEIGGAVIALRRHDAAQIVVEEADDPWTP